MIEKIKEAEDLLKKIPEEEVEKWNPSTFDELIEREFEDVEFLIEGLMPKQAITCLSGNPGCGKTWILLEVAIAVATGGKFLDRFQASKGRVLMIDEERRAFETQRRLKKLGSPKIKDVFISCLEGLKIDDKKTREEILQFCIEKEINLVIFDSLRAVNSSDENDSKGAQAIVDAFKEFTRRGMTVLITHHNRKESFLTSRDPAQILRGSIAILAGLTSLVSVDKTENLGKTLEMTISHAKMNEGEKQPTFQVALREDEEEKMRWEFIQEIEQDFTKIEKAKEGITGFLKLEGKKYQSEVLNSLESKGFTVRTLRRGLKELEKEGVVSYGRVQGEGAKKYYSLIEKDHE